MICCCYIKYLQWLVTDYIMGKISDEMKNIIIKLKKIEEYHY